MGPCGEELTPKKRNMVHHQQGMPGSLEFSGCLDLGLKICLTFSKSGGIGKN